MPLVPPYALMNQWLAARAKPGTTLVSLLYDDVVDVVTGLIAVIPVDEDWYLTTYPAVARSVLALPDETPASHYRKHGYFDRREPFAPGWRGLRRPLPFIELKARLKPIVARGRLHVEIERSDFLDVVRAILRSVQVDEAWYCKAYPEADAAIRSAEVSSAAEHYARTGYFQGFFPTAVAVDEDWYTSRYAHVRTGLQNGVATSALDHFTRIGYAEGCRPAPP